MGYGKNMRNEAGIVIRTYPSRESDLVLRIVSQSRPKLSLLAKQARKSSKKFGSGIDVFDHGIFESKQGKGSLPLVSSFSPAKGFRKIRQDIEKISAASTLCESFDLLLHEEGEDDGEPYSILSLTLEAIDDSVDLKETLKAVFLGLGQILSVAGYGSKLSEEQPTAKRLVALLNLVEQSAERKLESKDALLGIMNGLRSAKNVA